MRYTHTNRWARSPGKCLRHFVLTRSEFSDAKWETHKYNAS